MNLHLYGPSALELWRTASVIESRTSTHGRSYHLDDFISHDKRAACNLLQNASALPLHQFSLSTRNEDVLQFAKQWNLTLPLHILISDANQYRKNQLLTTHLANKIWLEAPYVPLQESVWTVTPTACLMQMAASLNKYQLLMLACEFCGMYVADSERESGVGRRHSLCSVQKLCQKVASSSNFSGIKKLRMIAPWVLNRSASFRETSTALALTLPQSMGGFGLCRPLLNEELSVPATLAHTFNKPTVTCDMVFPKAKLAIEYKGRLSHDNEHAWENDSVREGILKRMGYEVMNLANGQVFNCDRLFVTAQTIAKMLDMRLRIRPKDWNAKYHAMHAALFNGSH